MVDSLVIRFPLAVIELRAIFLALGKLIPLFTLLPVIDKLPMSTFVADVDKILSPPMLMNEIGPFMIRLLTFRFSIPLKVTPCDVTMVRLLLGELKDAAG